MQWALIATAEQQVPDADPHWAGQGQRPMVIAVVGQILNIIVYDGHSPFTPPAASKLEQVPDTARIGDTGY